jgi:hypothetical protein
MNPTRTVVLAFLILLLLPNLICAESWRGIVPLQSTKSDVERLLGKPSEATDKLLSYRFPSETVFISLITKDPDSLNLQALPAGTVKDIQVFPKNRMSVADLGLDENKIVVIRGSKPEYAGFEGYVNQDSGIIVKTNGRNIEIIFYFANAMDRANCPSCSINPQAIADIPICALCPTVVVSCPDEVEDGDPVSFTANIAVGTPSTPLTYTWTVTGARIIEGQGTDSIKVDSKGLQGKTITATVEVGGIDPACNKTASCSTPITRKP